MPFANDSRDFSYVYAEKMEERTARSSRREGDQDAARVRKERRIRRKEMSFRWLPGMEGVGVLGVVGVVGVGVDGDVGEGEAEEPPLTVLERSAVKIC